MGSDVIDVAVSKQSTIDDEIGTGKRVVLIDHEDSFVHTLGNYLRQTGADVQTLRSGPSTLAAIEKMATEGNKPDMVRIKLISCSHCPFYIFAFLINVLNILLCRLYYLQGQATLATLVSPNQLSY